jgi:hypothetical protein
MLVNRRSCDASVRARRASCGGFPTRCGETTDRAAAQGAAAQGGVMLDERRTLKILSWTLGTVCIGTLVLSALSLH